MNPFKNTDQSPSQIINMEQLSWLLAHGFDDWKFYGDVSAVTNAAGDLTLFNYTDAAQWNNRWNWFETVSRGLIMNNKTGEVVARPFDKFFNWGERLSQSPIKEVTNKYDGSLGILYRTGDHNQYYRIATRGSFDSEQALWATEWMNRRYPADGLDPALTLMFEIIYPNNRIVVDYKGFAGLVLIGARNRVTGVELWESELRRLAYAYKWTPPTRYRIHDVAGLLLAAKTLDGNVEGWVVRTEDNQRFKIKGDAYKLAHRMMTGVSFKRVLQATETDTLKDMIEGVPDEFLVRIREYQAEIEITLDEWENSIFNCYGAWEMTASDGSPKAYAYWVSQQPAELRPCLFVLNKSGRDALRQMLYKYAFKKRLADEQPESETE